MNVRALLVMSLVFVTSCSKCGGAKVQDASVAAEPVKHSSDLRTVLLTIFPEYRGTNVKSGMARLTRTYSAPDWLAAARASFEKNRVVEQPADAGIAGTLDQFTMHITPAGSYAQAIIELPVDGETLGKLYTNPASLSTSQLGLYLPREGVSIVRDEFDFELVYDAATERRAAFLTRQVSELMLTNLQWTMGVLPVGWGPNPTDGGYGEVPERFEVTLTGVVDGARVTIRRDGARVVARYALTTFSFPPER